MASTVYGFAPNTVMLGGVLSTTTVLYLVLTFCVLSVAVYLTLYVPAIMIHFGNLFGITLIVPLSLPISYAFAPKYDYHMYQ